jgi:hypothetical protein
VGAWKCGLSAKFECLIAAVPSHETALLTIGALWEDDGKGVVYPDAKGVFSDPKQIQNVLERLAADEAANRDLSSFKPIETEY